MDDLRELAETEARWLLRDFPKTPGARKLVEHHLGPGAIRTVAMRGREAELVTLHGRATICVQSKLGKVELRWVLLHELAEWHLQRIGFEREQVEVAAEALTAALVAPRDAFRAAVGRVGRDPIQLALDFTTTQTSAILRLAETDCADASAVVTTTHIHARANREMALPDLRKAARDGYPGMERHVLTDARRRIGLVAG